VSVLQVHRETRKLLLGITTQFIRIQDSKRIKENSPFISVLPLQLLSSPVAMNGISEPPLESNSESIKSIVASERPPRPITVSSPLRRDFLLHLEAYLARRDGVDKLLKISRYAAKIVLATPTRGGSLAPRLQAFESSLGLSRKAFRLGKFIQDVNSLRFFSFSKTLCSSPVDLLLAIVAFGGEGVYFFIEQLVWLAKAGLLPSEIAPPLQKLSTWSELIGYVGSVALKTREMEKIKASIEAKKDEADDDEMDLERLNAKLELKKLSIVQDAADGVMALSDVKSFHFGMGFSALVVATAGMISALISTHRNWRAC
jgi:Peroxisomal biogenesis factor 11 (PEX11)